MKPTSRRLLGIATGLAVGGAAVAWSSSHDLHRPGPMNTGHAELACGACHVSAPGTIRQQLQNVVRHVVGTADAPLDIGYRRVGNAECLACHERPEDRHPVFRFLEPRFAEARDQVRAETCTTCHREHHGARVTLDDVGFCRHCHADLALEHDPLDVSHATLTGMGAWATCLSCHDYHGNHAQRAQRRLDEAIALPLVQDYLDGGPSPFGPPVHRATQPEVTTP
jgi:hypothetical protein